MLSPIPTREHYCMLIASSFFLEQCFIAELNDPSHSEEIASKADNVISFHSCLNFRQKV